MQITHNEARQLIQSKLDGGINSDNEEILGEHIKNCSECRDYFASAKETGTILQQTLRKQWSAKPPPLQMDPIFGGLNSRRNMSIFLVTRTALVSVALFVFAVITWHLMTNGSATLQQNPLNMAVPLIPTPGSQFTATNTLQIDCQDNEYNIQPGDTLAGIAEHFSVSKESILHANDLTNESLISIQKLAIPICESTPTQTIHPPTFTITPILDTASTTPG
jgi:hypothetical protein